MLLLLDANVLFRVIYEPDVIRASTRQLLRDPANTLIVSYASLWKALAKVYRGKVLADSYVLEGEIQLNRELGAEFVSSSEEDILTAVALPDIHRDPFDRMLVAQAKRLRATIVSSDRKLHQYAVPVIPL